MAATAASARPRFSAGSGAVAFATRAVSGRVGAASVRGDDFAVTSRCVAQPAVPSTNATAHQHGSLERDVGWITAGLDDRRKATALPQCLSREDSVARTSGAAASSAHALRGDGHLDSGLPVVSVVTGNRLEPDSEGPPGLPGLTRRAGQSGLDQRAVCERVGSVPGEFCAEHHSFPNTLTG